MDPMALVAKLFDTTSHCGAPASPSLARQIPPPAAPTYTGQAPRAQLGPIAIAVTRPAVTYCAPAPRTFRTPGCVALLGPTSCQVPGECAPAFREAQPLCAASVASRGRSASGYARCRYA